MATLKGDWCISAEELRRMLEIAASLDETEVDVIPIDWWVETQPGVAIDA